MTATAAMPSVGTPAMPVEQRTSAVPTYPQAAAIGTVMPVDESGGVKQCQALCSAQRYGVQCDQTCGCNGHGGWASQQPIPFPESVPDEADVPLLEVSQTAVGEFRTARRCSLAEVSLLKYSYIVASGRRVDGHSDSGGAAPHHDQVQHPRRIRSEFLDHSVPIHAPSKIPPSLRAPPSPTISCCHR